MARKISAGLCALWMMEPMVAHAADRSMRLEPRWTYVADRVMGGVSDGATTNTSVQGREAARLTGQVSLDNNGGFIQMAFDVTVDVSGWTGLELDVVGNGETYDLRLKTDQLTRPWQSFRTAFTAPADWTTLRVPFDSLEPHRTTATFDAAHLRRVGILAVGRAFAADVAVAEVRLYRDKSTP